EFLFQLLNHCRDFLLTLCFNLLPQRLFDFSAFLDVTGFKLRPFLRAQLKTRVASGGIRFARNSLPAHAFPLTHQIALFRGHLHPKLRVALEVLTRVRWHCEPAFWSTRPRWRPMSVAGGGPGERSGGCSGGRGHGGGARGRSSDGGGAANGAAMLLRLRLCGCEKQSEARQADEKFTNSAFLATRYFHPRRSVHPDQPRRHNPVDRL